MSGEIDNQDTSLVDSSGFTPKQLRFINLYLSGSYTNVEISRLLNVSTTTIGNWLKLPETQQYIADYQVEEQKVVKDRLNALSAKAVDTMLDLLDSPMDGVRYSAARDVLDRVGHRSAQKMEIKKEVYTYDDHIAKLTSEIIDEVEDDDIVALLGDMDEE